MNFEGGAVESREFFDSEILEQSIVLAESLDKFHFFLNANHIEDARREIYKLAESHPRPFIFKNIKGRAV